MYNIYSIFFTVIRVNYNNIIKKRDVQLFYYISHD